MAKLLAYNSMPHLAACRVLGKLKHQRKAKGRGK